MKIYKRGDNGEFLMHSDTYLGEDYTSPNLVHWKYIKKERKNGRWVYYYDINKHINSDPKYYKLDYEQEDAAVKAWEAVDRYKNYKKAKRMGLTADNGKDLAKDMNEKVKDYYKKSKAYDKYNNNLRNTAIRITAKVGAKILNTVSSIRAKGKKLLKSIFG